MVGDLPAEVQIDGGVAATAVSYGGRNSAAHSSPAVAASAGLSPQAPLDRRRPGFQNATIVSGTA